MSRNASLPVLRDIERGAKTGQGWRGGGGEESAYYFLIISTFIAMPGESFSVEERAYICSCIQTAIYKCSEKSLWMFLKHLQESHLKHLSIQLLSQKHMQTWARLNKKKEQICVQ